MSAILPQRVAPLRFVFDQVNGGDGHRHHRRRQRGCENKAAAAVDQKLAQRAAAGDVSAESAKRFAQGAHLYEDAIAQTKLGYYASAARAIETCCVRFVDHHHRAVSLRKFDDSSQWRFVAVHAENRFRHNQLAPAPCNTLQRRFKLLEITMRIDNCLRARQAAAVDDAGMVQSIAEYCVALT